MAEAQAAVKEKIVKLAEDTFCGSGDIEAQDAKSFHQYFMQTYPPDSAELLSDLQGLENPSQGLDRLGSASCSWRNFLSTLARSKLLWLPLCSLGL